MKKYYLSILILFIISCKKSIDEPNKEFNNNEKDTIHKNCNNYIITGDKESGCIKYIDFVPDRYISPEYWEGDVSYSFDIQSDGVTDFRFHTTSWSGWLGEGRISKILPLDSNSIICSFAEEGLAAKYRIDTTINYLSNWSNQELTFAYDYVRYEIEGEQEYSHSRGGEWLSDPDSGYLGLRIINELDTIYAWVLMSAGTSSFCIREYAYQEK